MPYSWADEDGAVPISPQAVVLTSFPSAGLAATVAAHFMIRSLKLPRVGLFDGPDVAPIAVIQGGQVHPPIRVYGRPDVAAILSEFPPPLTSASAVGRTILEGAVQRRARVIVCFEGVVPHPVGDEEGPESPDSETVWFVMARPDPKLQKALAAAKARPLEDGVIGGVTGAMLVLGLTHPIPVVALLVSAKTTEGFPDHRAGAALIETLDRLFPELTIDTGPLRTQAELIEKALRAQMSTRPKVGDDRAAPPPADMTIYQ